jgi:GTPase SAR1 family protein
MKLIVVGCEYAGKSTLIREIVKWQREMYIHVNVHDHFTFPSPGSITGADTWDPIDQQKIMEMTPAGRERFNHWGHVYHVGNQPSWGLMYGDVIYEGYYVEDHV